MLNFSFSEMALIVVVSFLLFGPKELPGIIRGLSKFMRQCRDVIDECKAQLDGLGEETGLNELKAEKKYIRDQFGEMREVYDISDILAERKAAPPEPPKALTAPPPDTQDGNA